MLLGYYLEVAGPAAILVPVLLLNIRQTSGNNKLLANSCHWGRKQPTVLQQLYTYLQTQAIPLRWDVLPCWPAVYCSVNALGGPMLEQEGVDNL
jgi:hypothetical protein